MREQLLFHKLLVPMSSSVTPTFVRSWPTIVGYRQILVYNIVITKDSDRIWCFQVRSKRSPTNPTTTNGKEDINVTTINLATPSTENYAVIFNIVLWLMIGFFLAVLAGSYSIAFMDPGKDNIIYRATTQRMKSDWSVSVCCNLSIFTLRSCVRGLRVVKVVAFVEMKYCIKNILPITS